MNNICEQFEVHGMQASFHYADDTGKEWRSGDKHKSMALKIFDDNPELQSEMRDIARGFLWTLKLDRPLP